VSSLRSTVEGSGSPFADELHYLWASRGNEAGAADATRVGPTPPPATRRYRGACWATIIIYRTNAQHGVSETNPYAARFLWSLERKLSSAFHQLLGEIAVMQSQELPVLVCTSLRLTV